MKYRNLGKSGIKVSEISLGSWLTYGTSTQEENARACIKTAYDLGINYFDCANVYGDYPGAAEELLGNLLKDYQRSSLVISSKVYFPVGQGPNDRGLSRKHIFEQIDKTLKRMKTDYIDIYFCHRYDNNTPVEETLRALDDLIRQGKILYYGISEWSSAQILKGVHVTEKYNLDRIAVNQPRYNMLSRRIEDDVMPTCYENGIGLVVFSPLAQGILTGKYRAGKKAPEDSRANDEKVNYFIKNILNDETLNKVEKLITIADKCDLKLSQLALAWILRRNEVSSAIIGASRPEQIVENVKASEVSFSKEILMDIEAVLDN